MRLVLWWDRRRKGVACRRACRRVALDITVVNWDCSGLGFAACLGVEEVSEGVLWLRHGRVVLGITRIGNAGFAKSASIIPHIADRRELRWG